MPVRSFSGCTMRLTKARIQKYRSVRDTGYFDIETAKTILVDPNEAGKTVLLQALQQLNPPPGVRKFDALRDYPRSEYNDITTKKVDPASFSCRRRSNSIRSKVHRNGTNCSSNF